MRVNLYEIGVENADINSIETDFSRECKSNEKGLFGSSFLSQIIYGEFSRFSLYMETALTGFLYNIGFPCIFVKRDHDSESSKVILDNSRLFGIRVLYSAYLDKINTKVICNDYPNIVNLLLDASNFLSDNVRSDPKITNLINTGFSGIIVHRDSICYIEKTKTELAPITSGESTTTADVIDFGSTDLFLYGNGIYWDKELMSALDYVSDHNIMKWRLIGAYNTGDTGLSENPIIKKMVVGYQEYKLIDEICENPYFGKKFPPIITSSKKESSITFTF